MWGILKIEFQFVFQLYFLFILEKFELAVGQHTYPFAVMLPIKTPSSFNGTYGGIAYYAKAKIDIPLAIDKKERSGFTVINPLNLNLFPNLRVRY